MKKEQNLIFEENFKKEYIIGVDCSNSKDCSVTYYYLIDKKRFNIYKNKKRQ